MMRADANGDGVVTKSEAIAEATRRFERKDVNGDGKLDQSELAPRGHKAGGRHHRPRGDRMRADMPPPPPPPSGDTGDDADDR